MRKAIAVIGEGITEKYYIESLKGLTDRGKKTLWIFGKCSK